LSKVKLSNRSLHNPGRSRLLHRLFTGKSKRR
jgi:hypothetical protein